MKQPLASALQAAALLCLQHQVTLRVSHVAGVRNEWADALSRGFAVDADFWFQLQAEKRNDPKWRDLFFVVVFLCVFCGCVFVFL